MDMIFQGHVDVESPRKALRQLQSEEIGLTLRASRPEVVNRKHPNYEYLMGMNTETTATKPAGFPKTDAPQAFRGIGGKGYHAIQ